MKSKVLVIDDIPERHQIIREWLHFYHNVDREDVLSSYSYRQGIEALSIYSDKLDMIFLDHDFDFLVNEDEKDKTGVDIAKFMIEHELNIPVTIISVNPVGAKNIENTLKGHVDTVVYRPIYYFKFERV